MKNSTTSQNLLFPRINQLLTETIFQNQEISTNELAKQTLAKAEQLAQTYATLASNQIKKLNLTTYNHKNPQMLDQTIKQLVNRQQNIIQRAQYDLEQKLLT